MAEEELRAIDVRAALAEAPVGGGPVFLVCTNGKHDPCCAEWGRPVYRALSFLEQMGLIHRIESLNAFVACDTHDHKHTAGFLLCECCGQSEEIAIPNVPEIEASFRRLMNGFVAR